MGYSWRINEFDNHIKKDGGRTLNQKLRIEKLHRILEIVLERISSVQVVNESITIFNSFLKLKLNDKI